MAAPQAACDTTASRDRPIQRAGALTLSRMVFGSLAAKHSQVNLLAARKRARFEEFQLNDILGGVRPQTNPEKERRHGL